MNSIYLRTSQALIKFGNVILREQIIKRESENCSLSLIEYYKLMKRTG